ncbi:hypothetical protein ACLB2K_055243 [Fragaria x ananassa]
MLNLGVPNPSEAAEPPKGLALDWRWACTYTTHNPSPLADVGYYSITIEKMPNVSALACGVVNDGMLVQIYRIAVRLYLPTQGAHSDGVPLPSPVRTSWFPKT